MSAQPDRLPMIPELKPLAAHDYVAQLHFLWLGVSGLGIARCGWEMVTGKQATLSDVVLGVLLLCSPLVVACIWGGCLGGIAQHCRVI